VPKHVVADAAYDALMKFDEQLQLGMQRYLQRVNYVNLDTETTAVFIQTFSRSTSPDRSQDRDRRPGAGGNVARSGRRSRSPAKQPYLQSMKQDADDDAGARRRRTHPDDPMRVPASAAVQPHDDLTLSQIYVGRYARRTQPQASTPDTG